MSTPNMALLETLGAKYDDNLGAYFESPTEAISSADQAAVTMVTQLGLLKVSGEEAAKFLQGQITADMTQVTEGQAALGCHCNVKGRALASFLIFKKADDFYLVMDRDLIPTLMSHWQKYIAFSKAEMTDSSEDFLVLGLINELSNLPLEQPTELINSFATTQQSHFTLIKLQSFRNDALLFCELNNAETIFPKFSQNRLKLGDNAWAQANIQAGVASVMKETIELFIPLELNYQWVDGISFTKGCYTGQEIVARLHYRGKQKQRLYKASFNGDQLPELNSPIYSSQDLDQAIGHVVNCAWSDSGKISILAILKIDQALTQQLHINEKNGPQLEVKEVPYAITNE